jgi:MOSC domain-containing protein YiiM
VKRDSRCKIITLNPDTADANPEIMKQVARAHESKVGIYAVVLAEGTIRPGDDVQFAE